MPRPFASSSRRRSVRDNPSPVHGYSWRKRVTAAARNGSAVESRRRISSRRSGVGSRNACQAWAASVYCASLTVRRVSSSDATSSGLSSPRPLNFGRPGNVPTHTRLTGLACLETSANPGQQLNEIELIEQVVLEPQHQLVVGILTFDRAAPPRAYRSSDRVTDCRQQARRSSYSKVRCDSAPARRAVPRPSLRRGRDLHEVNPPRGTPRQECLPPE